MSAIAAGANFGSRILFSMFVSFPAAVVLAFLVGVSTAFLLNRSFVFQAPTRSIRQQLFWFLAINLFAAVLTLSISMLVLYQLLPALGIHWHAEEIAHAFGVVAPALASYAGHKYVSFR
ncbi:GtrA family protein [Tahibacter sp.]|uniref:GtrA family protein n=1 Tax=Tahibacter sp. TaxID=2056211 RepID=UPI0028C3899D|nr:GtrA family protein [Tahibacter sp.]